MFYGFDKYKAWFVGWETEDRTIKKGVGIRRAETESRLPDQSAVWESAAYHCTEGSGVGQGQTAGHAAIRGKYRTCYYQRQV